MDILVTGGGGFLGLSFAARALRDGHRVDLYDLAFPSPIPLGARAVTGDVTDHKSFAAALDESGADVVVHLATLLSDTCAADPVRGVRVNCLGSAVVFREAAAQKARRVIYAGSVSALARGADLPLGDDRPIDPHGVYGVTKAFAEHLAATFPKGPGHTEFLGLRFGWVYGAGRDRGWRALQQMIEDFAAGASEVRYPDYDAPNDWTYVEDAAEVLARCLDSPAPSAPAYNVAGDLRTVHEAVAHLRRRFPDARATPYPAAILPIPWNFVCDRLAREIGYAPATRLEDGLDRTLDALLKNRAFGAPAGMTV